MFDYKIKKLPSCCLSGFIDIHKTHSTVNHKNLDINPYVNEHSCLRRTQARLCRLAYTHIYQSKTEKKSFCVHTTTVLLWYTPIYFSLNFMELLFFCIRCKLTDVYGNWGPYGWSRHGRKYRPSPCCIYHWFVRLTNKTYFYPIFIHSINFISKTRHFYLFCTAIFVNDLFNIEIFVDKYFLSY